MANIANRPLFSSFVFIDVFPSGVFGISPSGSKFSDPGTCPGFNVATPTVGMGPQPASSAQGPMMLNPSTASINPTTFAENAGIIASAC